MKIKLSCINTSRYVEKSYGTHCGKRFKVGLKEKLEEKWTAKKNKKK